MLSCGGNSPRRGSVLWQAINVRMPSWLSGFIALHPPSSTAKLMTMRCRASCASWAKELTRAQRSACTSRAPTPRLTCLDGFPNTAVTRDLPCVSELEATRKCNARGCRIPAENASHMR